MTEQVARPARDAIDGRDGVDGIVAAWRRERPDLDVAPLEVLSRVSRLSRHLDIARRAAFERFDLEAGEFDVLTALRRCGPPYSLSPSRLASETLVTSGTMTNRLDRLERDGLVQRTLTQVIAEVSRFVSPPQVESVSMPRSPTCSTVSTPSSPG